MMKITTPLLQGEEVLVRLNMFHAVFWMKRIDLAVTTKRVIWKTFPFGKKENIIDLADIAEVKSVFHFWFSICSKLSCFTIAAKDGNTLRFGISTSAPLKNKDYHGLASGLKNLAKAKLGNEKEKAEAAAYGSEELRYMVFMDGGADKDSELMRDRLIEVINNAKNGQKWDANKFVAESRFDK
jgi:hypothetical protein